MRAELAMEAEHMVTINESPPNYKSAGTSITVTPARTDELSYLTLYIYNDGRITLFIRESNDPKNPITIPIVDENLQLSNIIKQEAFTNDCR